MAFVFRKRLDIPVFVLANVIVDLEVLFAKGGFPHRYWHWHSLLVGTAVGIVWGLSAFLLRKAFKKIMRIFHMPYHTDLKKMLISGILGVWVHVFVDAIYHYDVQPFWPYAKNPLWRLGKVRLTQDNVKIACIVFLVGTLLIYASILRTYTKKKKADDTQQTEY